MSESASVAALLVFVLFALSGLVIGVVYALRTSIEPPKRRPVTYAKARKLRRRGR